MLSGARSGVLTRPLACLRTHRIVPRVGAAWAAASAETDARGAREQQQTHEAQPDPGGAPAAAAPPRPRRQTLDYTALAACVHELQHEWVPSKVEEVSGGDAHRDGAKSARRRWLSAGTAARPP